jgi:hypothetical protein
MNKINVDILLEIADYSLATFTGVSDTETVGSGEQITCAEYILNKYGIKDLNAEEWQLCLEAVGTGIDDAQEGWETNSDYSEV